MMPYITFRDTDKEGNLRYYILQRNHPHYVALISEKPVVGSLFCMTVPGYNLWVVFSGVLLGFFVPGYKGVEQEISTVFTDMTDWFLRERILKDPKKYKRWQYNAPIIKS